MIKEKPLVLPNELPPRFFFIAKAIRASHNQNKQKGSKDYLSWAEAMSKAGHSEEWKNYKQSTEYKEWYKILREETQKVRENAKKEGKKLLYGEASKIAHGSKTWKAHKNSVLKSMGIATETSKISKTPKKSKVPKISRESKTTTQKIKQTISKQTKKPKQDKQKINQKSKIKNIATPSLESLPIETPLESMVLPQQSKAAEPLSTSIPPESKEAPVDFSIPHIPQAEIKNETIKDVIVDLKTANLDDLGILESNQTPVEIINETDSKDIDLNENDKEELKEDVKDDDGDEEKIQVVVAKKSRQDLKKELLALPSVSEYQKNVLEFIAKDTGNAVIEAVAGSGKTTTLKMAANSLSEGSHCHFMAFNSKIVKVLQSCLPSYFSISTCHGLGNTVLKTFWKKNGITIKKHFTKISSYIDLLPGYGSYHTKYPRIIRDVALLYLNESVVSNTKIREIMEIVDRIRQQYIDWEDIESFKSFLEKNEFEIPGVVRKYKDTKENPPDDIFEIPEILPREEFDLHANEDLVEKFSENFFRDSRAYVQGIYNFEFPISRFKGTPEDKLSDLEKYFSMYNISIFIAIAKTINEKVSESETIDIKNLEMMLAQTFDKDKKIDYKFEEFLFIEQDKFFLDDDFFAVEKKEQSYVNYYVHVSPNSMAAKNKSYYRYSLQHIYTLLAHILHQIITYPGNDISKKIEAANAYIINRWNLYDGRYKIFQNKMSEIIKKNNKDRYYTIRNFFKKEYSIDIFSPSSLSDKEEFNEEVAFRFFLNLCSGKLYDFLINTDFGDHYFPRNKLYYIKSSYFLNVTEINKYIDLILLEIDNPSFTILSDEKKYLAQILEKFIDNTFQAINYWEKIYITNFINSKCVLASSLQKKSSNLIEKCRNFPHELTIWGITDKIVEVLHKRIGIYGKTTINPLQKSLESLFLEKEFGIEDLVTKRDQLLSFGILNEKNGKWKIDQIKLKRAKKQVKKEDSPYLPMSLNQFFDFIRRILTIGMNEAKDNGLVDFNDMIYAPVYLNLPYEEKFDWVFVDECQDLTTAQIELISHIRKNARVLLVGDPKQAIYGFAGANPDAFETMIKKFHCKQFPLSKCFRCPKNHIKMAQIYVPQIEAKQDAGDGEIIYINPPEESEKEEEDLYENPPINKDDDDNKEYKFEIPEEIKNKISYRDNISIDLIDEDTMLICRNNAPLINAFFSLIDLNVKARIEGDSLPIREIETQLIFMRDIVAEEFADVFEEKLDEKYRNLMLDILNNGTTDPVTKKYIINKTKLNKVAERYLTISTLYQALSSRDVIDSLDKFITSIKLLLKSKRVKGEKYVTLSSIHRGKGLEANTVIIYGHNMLPAIQPDMSDWEIQQEKNLHYIALTRAKEKLILIDVPSLTSKAGIFNEARSQLGISKVEGRDFYFYSTNKKDLYQFFPTPNNIVNMMIQEADISSNHKCLEPSAGNGNIALEIQKIVGDENIFCIDIDPERTSELIKNFRNVETRNFLRMPNQKKYDRILMNPPFSKNRYILHVQKALEMIKDDGIVVAIVPNTERNSNISTNSFWNFLKTRYNTKIIRLKENSFQDSGTGVNTLMLRISKKMR